MAQFKQRDDTDCGATCLTYIFHRYGLDVSVAFVRLKSGTTTKGTTALGLVETAKSFGFTAKGIKCRFESLSRVGTPCICHVILDKQRSHYVVIERVKKRGALVMDPATGKVQFWPNDQIKAAWTGVMIILTPTINFAKGDRESSARRLWDLICTQRSVLIQAFVGSLLAAILSLAGAIFVQKIVDDVIVGSNRGLLNLIGCGMVLLLVVRLALGYFQSVLLYQAAQRIDAALILGYYRHLMRLPQLFFDTMRVGEINSRISDAVRIRAFLSSTVTNLLLAPLILVASFTLMWIYSWQLAMLSLIAVPLNALIYLASDWRNKRYQRQIMERSADFSSQVVESVQVVRVVKAYQIEERMSQKIERAFVRLLKINWSAAQANVAISSAGTFVNQIYSISLLWVGSSLVLDSHITIGQLMSCQTLAGYLTGQFAALIGMNSAVRQVFIATDRLYELMDIERETSTGTTEVPRVVASIRFEKITFNYPGRLPILRNFSMTCRAGELVVLMGPSGCGKSTILSLLPRFQQLDSGHIYIDGLDYDQFELASLRRSIACVSQRNEFFAGTLVENLVPANPAPDIPRLSTICRRVGLMDFIESLPKGFATIVAENGTNFSGGQRQRMAIARALYLEAPIILFDEPTSSLDEDSDKLLEAVLLDLRQQKKIVIVATHDDRFEKIADVVIDVTGDTITVTPSTMLPQLAPPA